MRKYKRETHFNQEKFIQQKIANFKDIDFTQADNSELVEILLLETKNTKFDNCKFGKIEGNDLKITSSLSFNNCDFNDIVNFSNTSFKTYLKFKDIKFKDSVFFKDSIFNKNTVFDRVIFYKEATFRCDIEETKHHNDDKGLQFYNTEFKDEVSFYGRDWNMNSCIKDSIFHNLFWMTKTIFGEKFEMLNIDFKGKHKQDFIKCLEIFKNSLKNSQFDLYANEIEKLQLQHKDSNGIKIIANDVKVKQPDSQKIEKDMLTTKELADYWNMKENTLMGWRVRREGPAYIKIGSKVFYKLKDIEEYEATHQIKHRNWH